MCRSPPLRELINLQSTRIKKAILVNKFADECRAPSVFKRRKERNVIYLSSSAGALIGDTKINKSTHIKSKLGFEERGNRSTRRKTSRCRVENQQTQPAYDAEYGNRTRATLVGGECSHHYTNWEKHILNPY